MNFIENLRRAKQDKKMTTGELAALSEVPLGTLNKLFSGAIEEPKLSVALQLAKAMSMSLDELCGHSPISECLTGEEQALVDAYRRADAHAKEIILLLAEKEAERGAAISSATLLALPEAEDGKILLPLYLLPVSAGRGAILDGDAADTVELRSTRISNAADFALRVSGDSMEPRFKNDDILLVRRQCHLEVGEFGIFVGDGEGFFKKLGDGVLCSLNPRYADIPLSDFDEFSCVGKVIGRVQAGA